MNIAQALKEKNRLLKKITGITAQIKSSNRHRADLRNIPDVSALVATLEKLQGELVALKGRIAVASAKIQPKLAKMDTIRQFSAMLETLNTDESPDVTHRGYQNVQEIPVVVQMGRQVVDAKKEALTAELDALQDEVDTFNATTQV